MRAALARHAGMVSGGNDEMRWRQEAIDTMADTVTNHFENIDETFQLPVAAGRWPENVVGLDRQLDPADPVSAIRICLSLAAAGLEPSKWMRDTKLSDEIDRKAQSCDLVRDFIGLYSSELSQKITTVPTGSL